MTLAEKLRFLADRCEDGKPFLIHDIEYVFDKNVLCTGDWLGNVDIIALSFANLKLKPQREFTEDEKVILRNLPEQYNWIARDEYVNGLFAYRVKPSKSERIWWFGREDILSISGFGHLFQCIQWSDEEPCEFRRYL